MVTPGEQAAARVDATVRALAELGRELDDAIALKRRELAELERERDRLRTAASAVLPQLDGRRLS